MMENTELIAALRYCKADSRCGVCEWYKYCESRKRNNESCLEQLHDDAADALEAADKRIAEQQKQIAQLYLLLNNRINEITELEVQLSKEGEWIPDVRENKRGYFQLYGFTCSKCGYVVSFEWNYCPNCGAKMDGADGERRTE